MMLFKRFMNGIDGNIPESDNRTNPIRFLLQNRKEPFSILSFLGLIIFLAQLVTISIIIIKAKSKTHNIEEVLVQNVQTFTEIQFWLEILLILGILFVSILTLRKFSSLYNETNFFYLFFTIIFSIWIANTFVQKYTLNAQGYILQMDQVSVSTSLQTIIHSVLTILTYLAIIVFLVLKLRKLRKNKKELRSRLIFYLSIFLLISIILIIFIFYEINIGSYYTLVYTGLLGTALLTYNENASFLLGDFETTTLYDAGYESFTQRMKCTNIVYFILFFYLIIVILSIVIIWKNQNKEKKVHENTLVSALIFFFSLRFISFILRGNIMEEAISFESLLFLYPFFTLCLMMFMISPALQLFRIQQQSKESRKLVLDKNQRRDVQSLVTQSAEISTDITLDKLLQIKEIYDKITLVRLSQILEFTSVLQMKEWLAR